MSEGNDALDRESQLREEVTRLRAENHRLLAELERLATGDRGPGPGPAAADPLAAEAAVDGRGVAEGDQAALVTAAMTQSPMIVGASNSAEDTTYLDCTDPGSAMYVIGGGRGVSGVAQGPGLHGLSYASNGVVGVGMPNALNGVQGQAVNPGASGVYGQHDNAGYGVAGRSANIGAYGESTGSGVGVYGTSTNGDGVQAVSHNQSGVNGASVNSYGVRGFSANSVGVLATTNSATGAGLLAQNDSGAPGGVAVIALGQAGVGVYASGEQAAVQLGRNSLAGAPSAGFHTAGELVLDANADLYLCKASGSPGTWKLLG
ncbi:MAG TPA: hypothetical protein VHO93_06150 [Actinomycetota bacterium]|jgi:hypothetical protein|nr:hypothetical protein [Actinomycetota bacterium]